MFDEKKNGARRPNGLGELSAAEMISLLGEVHLTMSADEFLEDISDGLLDTIVQLQQRRILARQVAAEADGEADRNAPENAKSLLIAEAEAESKVVPFRH